MGGWSPVFGSWGVRTRVPARSLVAQSARAPGEPPALKGRSVDGAGRGCAWPGGRVRPEALVSRRACPADSLCGMSDLFVRGMTPDEFDAYRRRSVSTYAAEHVRAGDWCPDQALELAEKETDELLPDGVKTAGGCLAGGRERRSGGRNRGQDRRLAGDPAGGSTTSRSFQTSEVEAMGVRSLKQRSTRYGAEAGTPWASTSSGATTPPGACTNCRATRSPPRRCASH